MSKNTVILIHLALKAPVLVFFSVCVVIQSQMLNKVCGAATIPHSPPTHITHGIVCCGQPAAMLYTFIKLQFTCDYDKRKEKKLLSTGYTKDAHLQLLSFDINLPIRDSFLQQKHFLAEVSIRLFFDHYFHVMSTNTSKSFLNHNIFTIVMINTERTAPSKAWSHRMHVYTIQNTYLNALI